MFHHEKLTALRGMKTQALERIVATASGQPASAGPLAGRVSIQGIGQVSLTDIQSVLQERNASAN